MFVLLRGDPEPSTLPRLLANGIEHGSVSITGALGLLGQCAAGDELETLRLTRELFSGLSDRPVDMWGLEDDPT